MSSTKKALRTQARKVSSTTLEDPGSSAFQDVDSLLVGVVTRRIESGEAPGGILPIKPTEPIPDECFMGLPNTTFMVKGGPEPTLQQMDQRAYIWEQERFFDTFLNRYHSTPSLIEKQREWVYGKRMMREKSL